MSVKKPRVRFAPSPTGYLHLGNARMAVLNYLLSLSLNGDYLLRFDDTDIGRVKPEYIDMAKVDLEWLGITWNDEFKQSSRLDVYNHYLNILKDAGIVYPCYETQEELEYKKRLQLAKGKPPIYDRSMLTLTKEQQQVYEKEGRRPYYRFKIDHNTIELNDLIKGQILFEGAHISDPVIVREDGSFLYILTSVIDDAEKSITHIIRGEDHIVNTAVQIQMWQHLQQPLPTFAHIPLITNAKGEGFSKRDGSLSLHQLRQDGINPMAINNYLFILGLAEQNKVYLSLQDIVEDFNLTRYNGATAKFDEPKLLKFNLKLLQDTPFSKVHAQVLALLKLDITETFWEAIKHNINTFKDIVLWYNICYSDIDTVCENKELLQIALDTLPETPFDKNTWDKWIEHIRATSNLKAKELFHPLRMAFTGHNTGPDFKSLIMLIGKDRLMSRLNKLIK